MRVLLTALVAALALAAPASAASPDIVISQVYGGGGNSGATLKNDFIELYNRAARRCRSMAGASSTRRPRARTGRAAHR
jgi:hypothetical protein